MYPTSPACSPAYTGCSTAFQSVPSEGEREGMWLRSGKTRHAGAACSVARLVVGMSVEKQTGGGKQDLGSQILYIPHASRIPCSGGRALEGVSLQRWPRPNQHVLKEQAPLRPSVSLAARFGFHPREHPYHHPGLFEPLVPLRSSWPCRTEASVSNPVTGPGSQKASRVKSNTLFLCLFLLFPTTPSPLTYIPISSSNPQVAPTQAPHRSTSIASQNVSTTCRLHFCLPYKDSSHLGASLSASRTRSPRATTRTCCPWKSTQR